MAATKKATAKKDAKKVGVDKDAAAKAATATTKTKSQQSR